MFFPLPDELLGEIDRVEALLNEHKPWPSSDLSRLSGIGAGTPNSEERFATIRLLIVDVDGLLQDTRWALGNGLLIIRAFPEVLEPTNEIEGRLGHFGIPSRVHLLLSGLLAGRDRVIYRDLLERRSGGERVGAWMVKILTDHSVLTSIAILDRLAHLIILAADVPAPRGRMYFRSGKLELLASEHGIPIPADLTEFASGEDLDFLLKYRDGFAHTSRMNVAALGNAAVDDYLDSDGAPARVHAADWSPVELVGISALAYEVARIGLKGVTDLVEVLLTSSAP